MARAKKEPVAAPTEINEELVRQDMNAIAAIHDIQAAYGEERDLVNQLLGQAQMAGAFEDFSRTVRTSKLAFVKENKLYRALAGKNSPHGAENLVGTWEEFCNLLGRSVDQVDRDIANLRAFGEEALESMSRMGIGYRELRQYRRLPEDQKTALIEAAKTGDKDSFLDLAEELIAKHTKEKESLQGRVFELEAEAKATEKLLGEKNTRLDQALKELEIKPATTTWPEQFASLNEEIGAFGTVADEVIGKHLMFVDACEAFMDQLPTEHLGAGKSCIHRIGEAIERLCHLVASLRDQYETRLAGYAAEDKSHILPATE